MMRWWVMFKWHWLDYKGRRCIRCGFYEASHYDHALEFNWTAPMRDVSIY